MLGFLKQKDNLTPFRRTQIECLKKYRGQKAKEQPKQAIGFYASITVMKTTGQYINQQKHI